MKKEFIQYILTIGMTDSLIHRVEELYNLYSRITDKLPDDIFVSEYIDKEGARHYENLWFFSGRYWMEAKNFLTKIDFDQANFEDYIRYWEVTASDYDFSRANDKSRLSVIVQTDIDLEAEFKASKENCDFLKTILLKRISKTKQAAA